MSLRDRQPLKSTELAWAAGFFDGEGSFGCYTQTVRHPRAVYRYPRFKLQVGQRDIRPLERFHAAVYWGHVRSGFDRRYDPPKPYHNYVANGAIALKVINQLWPYLSEPKREQVTRAREKYESSSKATVEVNP